MPRRTYAKKRVMRRRKTRAGGGAYVGYRAPRSLGNFSTNSVIGALGSINQRAVFPNRYYFKDMKYQADLSFNSGAAGVIGSTHTLQLNSLYSPQLGGGHQPYEYDQAAALYNFYKVTKVTVVLRWYATSSNKNMPAWVLKNASDTYTISGRSAPEIGEINGGFNALMNIDSQGIVTWARTYTPAEIDGLTRRQNYSDDSRYLAQTGANPAAVVKMELGMGNVDGTMSESCRVNACIYFTGYFIGRKIQGPS